MRASGSLLSMVAVAVALTSCAVSRSTARTIRPVGATAPSGTATEQPPVPSHPAIETIPPPTEGVIDHGDRSRPLVALTFDSNLTTAMVAELDRRRVASFDNTEVIDELDRLQVPATFFLAGMWMERYPDTVRRLAADPLFELGSHSYAHVGFAPRCFHLGLLPPDRMAPDVERSEAVLRQFTDHPTPFFRFPGGCANGAALRAITPAHVIVIGYDVASGDAFGTSVSTIVRTTVTGARDGSIVVLHVTGGNTAPLTAKALPAIVAGLRARGFTLVKVSDLLGVSSGDRGNGSVARDRAGALD